MSYSRTFNRTITVHYSGSVSYPASQNGGTVSYSGTASKVVSVRVTVDTNPFDRSVQHCNSCVNTLTGAIVATESAQVASIRDKADKVGNAIVSGFFKTVRSEISQQIMELGNRIDATLLHLRELAKNCVDKQRQMEVDYGRISSRYSKIFEELNRELENRIYEIDRPVFAFKQHADSNAGRLLTNDMVGTVAISGAETGKLEAGIGVSVTKRRALNTIQKANRFLQMQKETDDLLSRCKIDDGRDAKYYVPVCFMETSGSNGRIDRQLYRPSVVDERNRMELMESFQSQQWQPLEQSKRMERIQDYFNVEAGSYYSPSKSHDERVMRYLSQFINNNSIQTI